VCRRITEGIYNNGVLGYDKNAANYVSHDPPRSNPKFIPTFDCAKFLDSLKSRLGPSLDCSDVASAVCALSNLLGANLYEDKMRVRVGAEFQTVKVRAMGSRAPNAVRHRFPWHEVAWNSPGGPSQAVWDGCFAQVASRVERLPIHLVFRDYRRLWIAPEDQHRVYPSRMRPLWRRIRTPDTRVEPYQYSERSLARMTLPGWNCVHSSRSEQVSATATQESSLWLRKRDLRHARLMCIRIVKFKTKEQANRWFTTLPTTSAVRLAPLPKWSSSTKAYGPINEHNKESLIYLLSGPMVVRVSSTGKKVISIRNEARAVSRQTSKL
jgi:hypothetical protein